MRLFLFILFLLPFQSFSAEVDVGTCKYSTGYEKSSESKNVTKAACDALAPNGLEDIVGDRKAKFYTCNPDGLGCKGVYEEYFKDSSQPSGWRMTSRVTNKYYSSWIKTGTAPEEPCKTPKTDDQCNKGKTATITGNDVFWATGNYKGCTFTAADGVFIKLADGTMTGDATSTGSTGKSWCETTDSSYNPADDEALSKNPAFSPAKDNDPKNCKNGWVQAGGGKFHCLNDTSGNVDAPPDKVNPEDGSINSDKDGKPKPPDAGVGKPPTGDGTGGDGGGGSGGDGGGGDCEGEDCEGGGGGTKPPARPADPWADILDAADVARVKADTQSVQDELADFYRSAASGFQINISKPSGGSMPSFGDLSIGGDKVSLSVDWLDKISFVDARAGVLVLCALWAAYIILVRR